MERLIIDYFDPVVKDWNETAYEQELSERRNCDYLLYVLTPKMTGYYAVAEVTDDSYQRPDRTIYCYLPEDDGERFTDLQLAEFEALGEVVKANGAIWLKDLDEVVAFLNTPQPALQEDEVDRFDAFVCYGRRESFGFANKLSNRLSELNYQVFHDAGEIPMIIENKEYIYSNILRSDNFIYVISPNAVRSEYCKKELDFAIKYKKRIIPILHHELGSDADKLDDIVARKTTISLEKLDYDLSRLTEEIVVVVEEERDYVQQHSHLLFMARSWDASGRQESELLYGAEKQKAIRWLKTPSEVVLPLQIHHDYIAASRKISSLMRIMMWLDVKTRSLTYLSWFDKFTLLVGLGNPLALTIQLYELFDDSIDYDSISVNMWVSFLVIQLVVTFEVIKRKDLSAFLRNIPSMIITLLVILIVIYKRS